MRRLLDAGMRVFAQRGYEAARVDDIVRAARASHGTFYLYFADKEDLLRALAVECGEALTELSDSLGPVTPDAAGYDTLRDFLAEFLATYRRYGPVLRAWMEGQVHAPEVNETGVGAFSALAEHLGERISESTGQSASSIRPWVQALIAMLERFSYVLSTGDGPDDTEAAVDALTTVVHRGFFGASRSPG